MFTSSFSRRYLFISACYQLAARCASRGKISSLVIIGHSNRETELIEMDDGSFGSAQIAFGTTKTVDEKSLVTIVEREDGPNTAAIMLPSDNKEIINLVDLREAKRK